MLGLEACRVWSLFQIGVALGLSRWQALKPYGVPLYLHTNPSQSKPVQASPSHFKPVQPLVRSFAIWRQDVPLFAQQRGENPRMPLLIDKLRR